MFRKVAYWCALILSVLFVLAAIAVFIGSYIDIWAHASSAANFPWGELLPFATILLTAVSTFSAVFFGWRLDRRQSRELELKVKELELKIADARQEDSESSG